MPNNTAHDDTHAESSANNGDGDADGDATAATSVSVPTTIAESDDVYADRTVDEVKTIVRDADQRDDLTATDLEQLYEYEAANKARVTLTSWLADRIRSRGGTVPATDHDHDDIGTADGVDPEAPDADADGDDADADADYEPGGTTQVSVRAPSTGYYNGYWFDNAGVTNIEWSPRLEEPIRDGELELVAARDESVIPPDLRP